MLLLSGIAVTVPAYAEELAAVTMEDLLASSDVVLSENAMSGAPVAIVAHPEAAEGGKFLKTNFGLTIAALIRAWKQNARAGLELLPRDLIPRPTGTSGGSLITNAEFTTDVSGWTAVNAYGGATDFGPILAPGTSVDGKFAVAHTGPWDNSNQGSLTQTVRVNTPQDMMFTVSYNFITTEWSQNYGTQFNDNATVTVSDPSGANVKFALFESLNSSAFTPVSGLPETLNNDRGNTGGTTGWLTSSSETIFFDRGDYKIRIEVNDVSDKTIDSAILVDMVSLQ